MKLDVTPAQLAHATWVVDRALVALEANGYALGPALAILAEYHADPDRLKNPAFDKETVFLEMLMRVAALRPESRL